MPVCRTIMVWSVALIVAASSARAVDSSNTAARQVTGLFMQSCLRFAGDKDGLRNWARKIGLQALPAAVQERFLYGSPGTVFDASNQNGKFVLVSEDGGACSAIAAMARGPDAIADLEKDMNEAKITYRMTAERRDAEENLVQHREYVASRGDRNWLLSISTVEGTAGGQVMLTASRN
jgi:hypothetical protein